MIFDRRKNPIWKNHRATPQLIQDNYKKWFSKKCLARSSSEDSSSDLVAKSEEVKELTVGDIEGPSHGKLSETEIKQKKKKGKYLDAQKSKVFFEIPKAREDEKQLKKLLSN